MTYIIKPLSSLDKVFIDSDLSQFSARESHTMLRNQRLAYQIAVYHAFEEINRPPLLSIALNGPLAKYTTVRQVLQLPSLYSTSITGRDENYLRTEPGFFPDPLRPLHYQKEMPLPAGQARSIWLEVELPDDFPAGSYVTDISFQTNKGETVGSTAVTVRVLDAVLPPQKLIHTEWFYTDCIAEAGHVKAFSKRHWELIEDYLRVAVRNGINMILTPIFTPELDTYIGGERLTTQLVGITVLEKNRYAFDFSQLERWIDLCRGLGVEYYEMPHFFTQWGAKHAPKIVARVGNRTRRIFGWETDALGEEYACFLSQFIPALLDCLRSKGVDKQCFFHVSDEPHLDVLDHYKACRELLTRYLGDGYPIIDALSDIDFYASGAIRKPIPGIKSIRPFLEKEIDGLWAYYCEAGGTKVTTGRQLSMPACRTRILGVQLWLANIEGFLHWGYNFYHNRNSYNFVNPLAETSGECFAPSGDAFLVYPDHDGTPLESIRLNAMREAMDDMRALDLVASKKGRSYVEEIIRSLNGGKLPDFFDYPQDPAFLLNLRDRLMEEVE